MNQLRGEIIAVQTEGSFSLVDVQVGSEILTALLVETPESAPHLQTGASALVLFKETEVSLGREPLGELSLRNRLPAQIVSLRQGELFCEVGLASERYTLRSVITARAALRLRLAVGDDVVALIKANEVMLRAHPHVA